MKKILVVDDERTIVEVLSFFLKSCGHDVVGAYDGVEALEIFRFDPSAFDVVITDLSMPKMSGIELSEEILKIRSDIPIIWCTGDHLYGRRSRPDYVRWVLLKPNIIGEIREIIESL